MAKVFPLGNAMLLVIIFALYIPEQETMNLVTMTCIRVHIRVDGDAAGGEA